MELTELSMEQIYLYHIIIHVVNHVQIVQVKALDLSLYLKILQMEVMEELLLLLLQNSLEEILILLMSHLLSHHQLQLDDQSLVEEEEDNSCHHL